MGKKIKLKAYVVISPFSHYRHSGDNIYFGRVAHRCASEVADEESGFVVPLEGEYDSDQLIEIYRDQVDRYVQDIARQTAGDKRYWVHPENGRSQADYVFKLEEFLKDAVKQLEEIKKEYE